MFLMLISLSQKYLFNNKKRKNIKSFLYSNYVNKRGVKKIKFFNIPVYSKKISN